MWVRQKTTGKNLGVWLSGEMYATLKEHSHGKGWPMSYTVRQALHDYFDNLNAAKTVKYREKH